MYVEGQKIERCTNVHVPEDVQKEKEKYLNK